jgi:cytosine/adenosine deaminase-related metal-dependent hydrolase
MYRKFKADQLFTGKEMLGDDMVLVTEEDGTVADLIKSDMAGEGIESLSGILLPGLVNGHCHLELSHLKGVIPPHTGLIDFLCSVVTKRDFDPDEKYQAISKAEEEMDCCGIVAVGDICNTADAIGVKRRSRICWSSFIEVLSFTDAGAGKAMSHYEEVLGEHMKDLEWPNQNTLTPHAPYSISPKTFELINQATTGHTISIHNQEHPAEDELYRTGGGDLLKLFSIFGVHESPFPVTGKSSLRSFLPHFRNGQTIILVHNTYMPEEDLDYANQYAKENGIELIFCICINANLYIESKTPPIEMFRAHGCKLILGTDSYSSNWQLDISKEIFSIQESFPSIPLSEILKWATHNGAEALGMDDRLGSFKKGRKPGVVLINEPLDNKLSPLSHSTRIL